MRWAWPVAALVLIIASALLLMGASPATDFARVDRLPIPADQRRRTRALLAGLDPLVQGPVLELLEGAARAGVPVALSDGRRDLSRQKAYWLLRQAGQWSLPAARPTTRAWHFLGRAVDVTAIIDGRVTRWRDVPVDHWAKIGNVGKALGFVWGGDWRDYDPVHFEWRHQSAERGSPALTAEQAAAAAGYATDVDPSTIDPQTVEEAKRFLGMS